MSYIFHSFLDFAVEFVKGFCLSDFFLVTLLFSVLCVCIGTVLRQFHLF